MKYLSEVKGKGGIVARVVAKSCSVNDPEQIMCTFEVEHHRWILAEVNKHRALSNNYQSSRAVPVSKVIEQVRNNPATPVHWGAKQSGMQADNECMSSVLLNLDGVDSMKLYREEGWDVIANKLSEWASAYDEAGYHKQIVNRLTEPFAMTKGVISGTEWDNFFYLRRHKDAQPEFKELADCMWEAYKLAETEVLKPGQWHLPYVTTKVYPFGNLVYFGIDGGIELGSLTQAKKVSAASVAQVSFRKLDQSPEVIERVWGRLVDTEQPHSVCLEHQATPMKNPSQNVLQGCAHVEEGMTHFDLYGDAWSGNLKGWIQHRQLLPNHTCWKYEEQK